MIEIKVMREIINYARGIGGVGNVDWQATLECGHLVDLTVEWMKEHGFLTQMECNQCKEKGFKYLINYHTVDNV